MRIQDGTFTVDAEENGLKFAITGAANDGNLTPSKIEVTDGKKKVESTSVEKLPAEYREPVQKILDSVTTVQ